MPAIKVNGSRLAFQAFGAGSTVVALHSSASEAGQWKSLAEHLEANHCIFTPDLPGYGGSDEIRDRKGFSADAEADFIHGLIEAWQEPVHLVGHSYGGRLALHLALRHPEWIKSLTLIEPVAFDLLQTGLQDDARLLAGITSLEGVMKASIACGEQANAMAHFIDFWNGAGTWAGTRAQLRASLSGLAPAVVNNFAAMRRNRFTIADCRKLSVPALVVMGAESPIVSQRCSELLANAVPAGRLRIIGAAGHMVAVTDPHIVDPMIAAHLKSVDTQQASPVLPQAA